MCLNNQKFENDINNFAKNYYTILKMYGKEH